jgi:hypothetical protein
MSQPTEEGRKRHEPNGYYMEEDFGDYYPCTCDEKCSQSCKGGCGCEACRASYVDAMEICD